MKIASRPFLKELLFQKNTSLNLTISIILCTIAYFAFILFRIYDISSHALQSANYLRLVAALAFLLTLIASTYGNLVYLIARHGFILRKSRRSPDQKSSNENTFDIEAPDTVVLVPSYKEEEDVIFQTLVSAGLMEYPKRRVVLLIDDPPISINKSDAALLSAARRIPIDLNHMFQIEREDFKAEHRAFCERLQLGAVSSPQERTRIGQLLDRAAQWLEDQAQSYRRGRTDAELTHTDHLFIEKILLEQARGHRRRADEFRAGNQSAPIIAKEYSRLASLFDVEFSSFERKRFVNMSHESNKASNLNSYIGLLGGSYREVMRTDGLHLESCAPIDATLQVVDAKFVISLDADSLVCSDYALRLIQFLEQPGNERIGLVLTPYAAIRGSKSALERAAGAQTDMVYVLQQGYSHFDSAPWGGPNSILRRQAVEDIAIEIEERGYRMRSFIQDTTVIEDAGATIDLIRKGWRVTCYPERLCYSATPPDFGALVIQRERWSNGGLIILKNLYAYLKEQKLTFNVALEAWFRFYILAGSAMMAIGAIIVTVCSLSMPDWWPLMLIAYFIPYLILQAADAKYSKYKIKDLLKVYVLLSLLVPVVIGGTILSVRQMITGKKESFKRTPKVSGRTAVPLKYLLVIYSILFGEFSEAIHFAMTGSYILSIGCMVCGIMYLYGCVRFIGLRETFEDIRAQLVSPQWNDLLRSGARQLGSALNISIGSRATGFRRMSFRQQTR